MENNTKNSIIEEQPIKTQPNNIIEENHQEYQYQAKDDWGKIIKDTTNYVAFRLKIAVIAIAIILFIAFLCES